MKTEEQVLEEVEKECKNNPDFSIKPWKNYVKSAVRILLKEINKGDKMWEEYFIQKGVISDGKK